MSDILLKEEVFSIVGSAMEVYNHLGAGFLEAVYQEAMELELTSRNIPMVPQKEIQIAYKNQFLKKGYIADFLCYDQVIVEIKAMEKLTSREESQLINYMKATKLNVGVLINFGAAPSLEWRRMVYTKDGINKRGAIPLRPAR